MSVETFLSIVPSSLYRSIVKSDPKSFVFTLSIILMVFPLNWTCEKTKQKRFALNVKRNFLQNWGLFFQYCKRASEKLFLTQKTTWLEFHFLSSVCSGTLVSLAVPSAPVFLLLRFVELKLRLTPSKLSNCSIVQPEHYMIALLQSQLCVEAFSRYLLKVNYTRTRFPSPALKRHVSSTRMYGGQVTSHNVQNLYYRGAPSSFRIFVLWYFAAFRVKQHQDDLSVKLFSLRKEDKQK